jgi:seryl-tRNA synthetase
MTSFEKRTGLEEISQKAREAAKKINDLVSSMVLAVEEKVALQHQINNIARESEYMIDRIDDIAVENQKKVLLAYREYLKDNLESINRRLKELEHKGGK